MSSTDEPEQDGLAQRAGRWLRRQLQRGPALRSAQSQPPAPQTDELMQRAARCYARAGWDDDACRVFDLLGDDRQAAGYHERQGRWQEAALRYARVSDWAGAARCYLRGGLPDEAAECMARGNQQLEAAWTWAHLARRFRRAETALRSFQPQSPGDELGIELVRARCEAGTEAGAQAAARLHRLLPQLRALPAQQGRLLLYDWAFAVADALHRPDLTALLHATATAAGLPQAHERWERWALEVLGDANGAPSREA